MRRKYTTRFKSKILNLLTTGVSASDLSEKYKVATGVIYAWRRTETRRGDIFEKSPPEKDVDKTHDAIIYLRKARKLALASGKPTDAELYAMLALAELGGS